MIVRYKKIEYYWYINRTTLNKFVVRSRSQANSSITKLKD